MAMSGLSHHNDDKTTKETGAHKGTHHTGTPLLVHTSAAALPPPVLWRRYDSRKRRQQSPPGDWRTRLCGHALHLRRGRHPRTPSSRSCHPWVCNCKLLSADCCGCRSPTCEPLPSIPYQRSGQNKIVFFAIFAIERHRSRICFPSSPGAFSCCRRRRLHNNHLGAYAFSCCGEASMCASGRTLTSTPAPMWIVITRKPSRSSVVQVMQNGLALQVE